MQGVRACGGAAWLPWFATVAPVLIMLLGLLGLLIVCLYLGMAVTNFVWLYPILTAMPITPAVWQRQLWLPSWR